ncbi:MAG: DUF4465 domain-containing protein [Planctomycetia bacterium]
MTLRLILRSLAVLMIALNVAARADVVTFESLTLPPSSYANGNPGNLSPGSSVSVPFLFGGVAFANTFGIDATWGFAYWNGFAISNIVNTTDGTWTNQYAAKPGGGHLSANYAVAYSSAATIMFPEPVVVSGLRIANTTYAYAIMTEPDPNGFSVPLGQGGWFSVTATGSRNGVMVASEEFFLADLRGADPIGVRGGWNWFDLGGLGLIDSLAFSFAGSDVGEYGLNTPAYFAMDDLTFAVPEPGAAVLLACGVVAGLVARWARRR